jgi:hypothetical protein
MIQFGRLKYGDILGLSVKFYRRRGYLHVSAARLVWLAYNRAYLMATLNKSF